MKLLFFIFSFLLTQVSSFALAVPSPKGHITDLTGSLSDQTEYQLNNLLTNYSKNSSNEIGVLIVPNLEGTSLEDYANQVFRTWGLGKKDLNNGILVLVAEKEHKVRVEVGYGLEGALPDGKVGRLMDQFLTSHIKAGQIDVALATFLPELIKSLPPTAPPSVADNAKPLLIGVGILVGLLILTGLGSLMGITWCAHLFELIINLLFIFASSGGKSSGGGGFGGGSSGGGGSSR
jgi:uncharacterized protein